MDTNYVTTPFGRRPMTLAMLARQRQSPETASAVADKWKLFRALCEARTAFGLTDRSLALLNALLSFCPKTELSAENGLVVFPSNQQLSLRANGMSEPTIRRHIALLVAAGLITRKDSANGKRYVRRDQKGHIDDAFGFSIAPLLSRAKEIEKLAAKAVAERQQLRQVKEAFTICRRDIAKLIALADAEGVTGDWPQKHCAFRSIVESVPRNANTMTILEKLARLESLRAEIANILDTHEKEQIQNAYALQNERHIQISESESFSESEPKPTGRRAVNEGKREHPRKVEKQTSVSLALVLAACPAIVDYAPSSRVTTWNDLSSASRVVANMFDISPTAYEAACAEMGPISTAIAVSCILEKSETIRSPGGYLRQLTRKAAQGGFASGQMLMAVMRGRRHEAAVNPCFA